MLILILNHFWFCSRFVLFRCRSLTSKESNHHKESKKAGFHGPEIWTKITMLKNQRKWWESPWKFGQVQKFFRINTDKMCWEISFWNNFNRDKEIDQSGKGMKQKLISNRFTELKSGGKTEEKVWPELCPPLLFHHFLHRYLFIIADKTKIVCSGRNVIELIDVKLFFSAQNFFTPHHLCISIHQT